MSGNSANNAREIVEIRGYLWPDPRSAVSWHRCSLATMYPWLTLVEELTGQSAVSTHRSRTCQNEELAHADCAASLVALVRSHTVEEVFATQTSPDQSLLQQMDHLAIPSSHVANLDIIEEEEDANTLQPSLFQSTPNAQHTYPSTSSVFGHLSGTSNDIPGDEDVEPITTFDKYYDPRSETFSISSSRTFKSSFSRMTSASMESLTSVLPKLFGPSFGRLDVNIRQLVEYIRTKRSISTAEILDMTTYQCRSFLKHMFVILRLKQRRKEYWLRLDRRAEDPSSASFVFSGMRGPANDVVRQIYSLDLRIG